MCKQWFKGMFQGVWRGTHRPHSPSFPGRSQYVWGLISIGLLLLLYICGIAQQFLYWKITLATIRTIIVKIINYTSLMLSSLAGQETNILEKFSIKGVCEC